MSLSIAKLALDLGSPSGSRFTPRIAMSDSPDAAASVAARAKVGGCPVDHSKMSQEQWQQYATQHQRLNSKRSEPHNASESSAPNQTAPVNTASSPATALISSKPVCTSDDIEQQQASLQHSLVGDVFPSDSKPHPEQRFALSNKPLRSHIPKGAAPVPSSTDSHDKPTPTASDVWVYPSPQRFYNAMRRKGWSADERDMAAVVSIHNTVNEQTWKQVMQYEQLHAHQCSTPKLLKFRGRPSDPSPKARLMSAMGYTAPFDRHDWIVDRCGDHHRYIIDFYAGPEVSLDGEPQKPAMHIDARPDIFELSGAIDRAKMIFKKWF